MVAAGALHPPMRGATCSRPSATSSQPGPAGGRRRCRHSVVGTSWPGGDRGVRAPAGHPGAVGRSPAG
eukprot:571301-Alexandrium_andersonii.AAC.1